MKTLFLTALLLWPSLGCAQLPEDPGHQELRALRDGVVEAINKNDIEKFLTFLHPNVVLTYQNAEVARGLAGVKAYHAKTIGPANIIASLRVEMKDDGLSMLHGGSTAVACGSSIEHLDLAGGRHLDLNGRWTATLVKENNRWLIAGLHSSTNLFNNPFVESTKSAGVIGSVISLIFGGIAGFVMGRRRTT